MSSSPGEFNGYTELIAIENSLEKVPDSEDNRPLPNKTDVLQWFRQSTDSDASWVLNRLVEIKPLIVFEALAAKVPGISQVQDDSAVAQSEGARSGKDLGRQSSQMTGEPIIQFASSMYFAEEGVDDTMVVDVIRIGNQNLTSEVSYKTADDSAVSGRSYEATSGRLVFKPGVAMLHIEIPIIDNPLWDTTLEFTCVLTEEGLQRASLGQYLHKTRVKIIDRNHFPSENFKHLETPADIAATPKWQLLFGVFKWLTNVPNVWKGTMGFIAVDVCHNTWDLFSLYMNVYMLDYIVDTTSPSSALVLIHERRLSLLVCALLSLFSVGFFHYLDYVRISFPVKGPTKQFIQDCLLRKFLNYKKVVREKLQSGDMIMGMQSDTFDLIESGYINFLLLLKAVCSLVFMLGFKLSSPLLFGGTNDLKTFALLLSTPIFLAAFVCCRQHHTGQALSVRNNAKMEVTDEIAVLTTGYHLVIDYQLRNHCEHRFQEKQQRHMLSVKQAAQVLTNNHYFCVWCKSFSIATWLLYGGLQVINGSLSVGLFVTNLKLFDSVGDAYLMIYTLTIAMMETFPALVNITTLMNHPTDVKQRALLSRAKQAAARASRHEMLQKQRNSTDEVPIDTMAIQLNFHYPFKFEGHDGTLNFSGNVSFHQGQLVAVIGRLGCGKATLLHLIAGSVLPEEGKESPIFVPAHLRVANVADEPIFFGGSLYANLTYGMDTSQAGASRDRVKRICKRLTRSDTITDFLDQDEEGPWLDLFSGAQCKLLSIARGLVHNVEVLTIHKPLARLTQDDSVHVTRALHVHIDYKGLELDTDVSKRRPRTVIISASAASDKAVKEASNVISIDPLYGIRWIQDLPDE